MKTAQAIIKHFFNKDFHKKKIIHHTLNVLEQKISLTNCFHDKLIKNKIFKYLIKVNVFNYSKQLNNIMKGIDLRIIQENAPQIFKSAKLVYKKKLKQPRKGKQ